MIILSLFNWFTVWNNMLCKVCHTSLQTLSVVVLGLLLLSKNANFITWFLQSYTSFFIVPLISNENSIQILIKCSGLNSNS